MGTRLPDKQDATWRAHARVRPSCSPQLFSAHEVVHVSAVIPGPHQSKRIAARPASKTCKLHAITGEVRSLLPLSAALASVLGA